MKLLPFLLVGISAFSLPLIPATLLAQDTISKENQRAPSTDAPGSKTYDREEFNELFLEIMGLVDTAPEQALEQMIKLAETGEPKALQQVGTFFRQGIGTAVDLPAAKLWYERAIAKGRPYALAPLARTEAALGNGATAFDLLQRAIAEDMPGAERQLGLAHVDRQLGKHSNPQRGLEILMDLIDRGDDKAARPLLLRFNWNRLPLPAPPRLVEQVERDGLRGDGPSAEAALVYLTKAERYSRAIRARRTALIEVDGIRDRILASERMFLAADTSPRSFFREADRIIATTPREHFPRAALTAYRISPNAYVRILQRELRMQGYYHGRINGWLTKSTIAAHQRFCQDQGILPQCHEGPRKTDTIRAVTAALANYAPFGLK